MRARTTFRFFGVRAVAAMKNAKYLRTAMLSLSWALIAFVFGGSQAAPASDRVPREEAIFKGDETPLMKASAYGRIATIRQLLANGAAVDARNGASMTALFLAAWSGKGEAVAVLLQAGADPNAMSSMGETAVIQAIWSGDLPTIRTLIAGGANVNSADSYGGTALQLAAGQGNDAATRILLNAGADIGARRKGPIDYAALHYAAWTGNGATVKILLAAGARVNDQASGGWTPLMISMLLWSARCRRSAACWWLPT